MLTGFTGGVVLAGSNFGSTTIASRSLSELADECSSPERQYAMAILRSIRNRLRGIDAAYDDVTDDQLPRYQHYIDKVLSEIDIETETAWSANRPYDKQQLFRDEEAMERILAQEAVSEGLNPFILQVMVNQYFFADVYQRERDRDRWADRVLRRKDVDYFPDAMCVAELLNRMR